ncbi:MAG TPA: zf-HC2 domain-containing protein [Candidatus Acidoferrales bacterium]|nr:zf-HC2 domain-containing protein [Candidatus Acidoferrales bacterium]
MITCEEFLAEFGDYLENQVSPEVRKELELHLSECRACQVLYDSSRKTIKIVTESSSFELSEEATDPIIDRVMEKLRKEQS